MGERGGYCYTGITLVQFIKPSELWSINVIVVNCYIKNHCSMNLATFFFISLDYTIIHQYYIKIIIQNIGMTLSALKFCLINFKMSDLKSKVVWIIKAVIITFGPFNSFINIVLFTFYIKQNQFIKSQKSIKKITKKREEPK